MRELKIDPNTQDFVRDGKGGLVYAAGAETAVLHQVAIHFGEDWLAPDDGSRLHDLQYFTGDAAARIKTELERALTHLERRGRISEIEVTTTQTSSGLVDATTRYRDTRTRRASSFTVTT
jgi:phage baseplate assembly protein W